MRRLVVAAAAGATVFALFPTEAGVATAPSPGRPAAQRSCDPVSTEAVFGDEVPSPSEVLGFPLGKRKASNEEIGRYWRAADRASERVVTGVYGRSWEGRDLRYALLSDPATLARLPQVRRDLARLRDPATPAGVADQIVARTPPILWIAASVHGDEPSGADAVVRLLHELADRSDCVVSTILDHAIVGLMPVQNPDGREHNRRYNSYAFDMNRDGLAATQPEIAARHRLLWKYPPQLFVDEHENSGRGYFFPPDADPIYHETADGLYRQVEEVYGPANARAFRARGWDFETWRSGYDLFAQIYGDTVPTTQLGAVGMTFEQGSDTPYPRKVLRHYTSALSSLYAGATRGRQVLRTWRSTFVQAQEQGERCHLEPNRIYNPGHQLLRKVPKRPICGYFLLGGSRETKRVVSRLQDAHVVVEQLTRPTVVKDYRPYGDRPRREKLPAGTFWVGLDQPQKHWVQATLNEDTYVPFPYFYDVSGWSMPLLAGIEGGSTGTRLRAPVTLAPRQPSGTGSRPQGRVPRIAVIDQFEETWNDYQFTGWLKWRLGEDWRFPYRVLQPEDVTRSSLEKVDVLVVGNVDATPVFRRLGASGRSAVARWVDGGGRYVGWQEGALLAAALGISQVGMETPKTESPGAMMRILTPQGPNEIEWDSDYNLVLAPGSARVVGAFPQRMFVSGFAAKADALAGTANQTVETPGRGSVTLFGYEPNFRAIADGSARLLRQAILGTPTGSVRAAAASRAPVVQDPQSVLSLAHTRAWRVAHEERE